MRGIAGALTGAEQLKILLGHLHGRYKGAVALPGNADRGRSARQRSGRSI